MYLVRGPEKTKKNPYLEYMNHRMQIDKYCDMKGHEGMVFITFKI